MVQSVECCVHTAAYMALVQAALSPTSGASMAMPSVARCFVLLTLLSAAAAQPPKDATHAEKQLFGYTQGKRFDERGAIYAIRIYHGELIYGLQLSHQEPASWGQLHGSSRGKRTEIRFGYPEQSISQISGTFNPKKHAITSLSLVTFTTLDRRSGTYTTYGPFGHNVSKNQSKFASPSSILEVAGLWGFADNEHLNGLSYYYLPK